MKSLLTVICGFWLFGLGVCALLFLASCDGSDTNRPDTHWAKENTLRFDVNMGLDTLDPMGNGTGGETLLFPLLYSYLFVPDVDGKLKPDLAVDWQYDADDLTWTIQLRSDAVYHDDRPVTAMEVVRTLNRWVSEFIRDLAGTIDRIEAVSDTVLRIHAQKAVPDLPERIWDFEIFPEPATMRIDWFNHPIGSGPFMFQARKGQKEVILAANPSYYGGHPSIDQVIFYFEESKEKSWARLLRGETDIISEITPRNHQIMGNISDQFHFRRYLLGYYTILLYNTRDPLFADPRVRRALTHAIDREYILGHILKGYGEVARTPMGSGSRYENPDMVPLAYNPEKSLDLLRAVDWIQNGEDGMLYRDGRRFEFTIDYPKGYDLEERVANYIKLSLAQVGIKTQLNPLPYDTLVSRYHRNDAFQAVLTELNGIYRNPEVVKALWACTPPEKSIMGSFYHLDVSARLDDALSQSDSENQRIILQQVDALIQSLQPGTFLFHKTAIDVMSNRVRPAYPFSLTYPGIYRLQFATIP